MQMMQIVPVFIDVVGFAIQDKFTAIDAITNSSNSCAEVRVSIWLNAFRSEEK